MDEIIVFSFIVDVYGDDQELKALACNNRGMTLLKYAWYLCYRGYFLTLLCNCENMF